VAAFGLKTATSTLRKHLAVEHPNDWISTCDKEHIEIKAYGVQEFIAKYRQEKGEQPPDAEGRPRQPYSREGFVDAIVEWIVTDDQVNSI
jgi:hypothetical protein